MIQAIAEIVIWVIFHTIFIIVVQFPGYWLLRCRYKSSEVGVDGDAATVAGLLLWAAIGGTIALLIWLD